MKLAITHTPPQPAPSVSLTHVNKELALTNEKLLRHDEKEAQPC